jgi:hypothetical protein
MKGLGMFKGLVAVAMALIVSASANADSVTFRGQRTDVNLTQEFLGAITSLGLTPSAVKPGKIIGTQARFPIIAGALDLDNAASEIIHSGGIQLKNDSVTVQLTNFIIDTTSTPVLTGLVKANGAVVTRLPLFKLALPSLSLPIKRAKRITIPDVGVTLTAEAASTLNSVFGVTAFAENFSIGVAHVIIRR